ncbi:hypothetical protein RUM43_009095 [Polyplax serrata]|uniref:Uncharacterized protein n=1 Tax=Polyplax serrata TaxID=468196 RepID=A0AAN8PHP4_POLSC
MKTGVAAPPAAWILERSIDGIIFSPWQYFADSEVECERRYGMPGTHPKPHYKTDDEVNCLINYSKLHYLENPEVHVSLLNGRPGHTHSSDVLKNFTLARYVRFRLQKMYKTEKDLALRKKLFYSIRTIIIGGQCLCHGHASKCTMNKATGLPTCECEHNTCGKHCDECCPMFNQVPWSPGTLDSSGKCEECECHGHSDTCVYDSQIAEAKLSMDVNGYYRGGGHCLNCRVVPRVAANRIGLLEVTGPGTYPRNHTTGVNCEKCEKGWYRPAEAEPDDLSPCLPCDCHPIGSTGVCTEKESPRTGTLAGVCECKENYVGLKCDECAPGRRNFPDCEPCPCDPRGSLNNEACVIPCTCKENVEGKYCEKCKYGFFGLSQKNPEGCTKCYCSGITQTCEEANQTIETIKSSLKGWLVADLSTTRTIVPTEDPDTDTMYIGNYELPGVESYYWLAPPALGGSQIGLYGGVTLNFTVGWEAMRGDTSGQPTVGPNIILVGSNGVRLGYGEDVFKGRKGNTTLSALLIEDGWYIIPPEVKDIRTRLRRTEYRGATISREQFLGVLANLTHIMLRAKFHTDQVEGSLLSMSMEPVEDLSERQMYTAERCACPLQYSGLSCESCAFGHYKPLNSSFELKSQCFPCNCSLHSDCDAESGICKACQHNTMGDNCELCMDGFYGNATAGTPNDCKPCACPLLETSNNFSPKCEFMPDDYNQTNGRPYYCTDCPVGYIGDFCELCDEFYFGNPLEIGGKCQPCDCNGAPCDSVTGECVECLGNTEGPLCDKCKPLHYRDANSSKCLSCDCEEKGSRNETCDVETGQCDCSIEYSGRTCNECAEGYGYSEGACEECNCGIAARNGLCDPGNGTCDCQAGAEGPKCDKCEQLHFGLTQEGCQVVLPLVDSTVCGTGSGADRATEVPHAGTWSSIGIVTLSVSQSLPIQLESPPGELRERSLNDSFIFDVRVLFGLTPEPSVQHPSKVTTSSCSFYAT